MFAHARPGSVRSSYSNVTVGAKGDMAFAAANFTLETENPSGEPMSDTGRVSVVFERRDDGFPLLSEHDESTIVPGVFLCGPAVRHENHVFCFIYKYRQRFAVVAKAIANSLGLPAEELETYRLWGMYLDDLSCCGEECVC